jgi:integral membrane protein
MPATPRRSDAPRIRSALKLYKVTSVITGTFLLLLCLMMVFRYGFGVDIEFAGPQGLLALTPKDLISGVNLSTVILIVHGWFYVLYLFSDFRIYTTARLSLLQFLLIALGGIIPLSSFIIEHFVHRKVTAIVERLEAPLTSEVTA